MRYIIIVLLWLVPVSMSAQDIIFLKSGDQIQSKIIEVGTSVIQYADWNNRNGPLYRLGKEDIWKIRFENGFEEVFDKTILTESLDVILLVNGEIIKGRVKEVSDVSIIYELEGQQKILAINQIARITYQSGYVEEYAVVGSSPDPVQSPKSSEDLQSENIVKLVSFGDKKAKKQLYGKRFSFSLIAGGNIAVGMGTAANAYQDSVSMMSGEYTDSPTITVEGGIEQEYGGQIGGSFRYRFSRPISITGGAIASYFQYQAITQVKDLNPDYQYDIIDKTGTRRQHVDLHLPLTLQFHISNGFTVFGGGVYSLSVQRILTTIEERQVLVNGESDAASYDHSLSQTESDMLFLPAITAGIMFQPGRIGMELRGIQYLSSEDTDNYAHTILQLSMRIKLN